MVHIYLNESYLVAVGLNSVYRFLNLINDPRTERQVLWGVVFSALTTFVLLYSLTPFPSNIFEYVGSMHGSFLRPELQQCLSLISKFRHIFSDCNRQYESWASVQGTPYPSKSITHSLLYTLFGSLSLRILKAGCQQEYSQFRCKYGSASFNQIASEFVRFDSEGY